MKSRRDFLKQWLAAAATAAAGSNACAQAPGEEQPSVIRYSCYYQVSRQVIDILADTEAGLPRDSSHIHVFAHSHASVFADASLADYIHSAGSNFAYAPAFDLNKFPGWGQASEAQLAAWARTFRDDVIPRGADYFAFNELPTNAATSPQVRDAIMTLLAYLNEPDGSGNSLQGVFFMTHAPSMPANWSSPASDFWERVDQTCALVVAEHYHGNGFICLNGETFLSDHFFGMRDWLAASGEPAKISIANNKFTILHSSRYGPGPSGWQGADSNTVSFEQFQRDLSRCAMITRNRAGGYNRIAFAPLAAVYTDPRVLPVIAALIQWHYNQDGASDELACIGGDTGSCVC